MSSEITLSKNINRSHKFLYPYLFCILFYIFLYLFSLEIFREMYWKCAHFKLVFNSEFSLCILNGNWNGSIGYDSDGNPDFLVNDWQFGHLRSQHQTRPNQLIALKRNCLKTRIFDNLDKSDKYIEEKIWLIYFLSHLKDPITNPFTKTFEFVAASISTQFFLYLWFLLVWVWSAFLEQNDFSQRLQGMESPAMWCFSMCWIINARYPSFPQMLQILALSCFAPKVEFSLKDIMDFTFWSKSSRSVVQEFSISATLASGARGMFSWKVSILYGCDGLEWWSLVFLGWAVFLENCWNSSSLWILLSPLSCISSASARKVSRSFW